MKPFISSSKWTSRKSWIWLFQWLLWKLGDSSIVTKTPLVPIAVILLWGPHSLYFTKNVTFWSFLFHQVNGLAANQESQWFQWVEPLFWRRTVISMVQIGQGWLFHWLFWKLGDSSIVTNTSIAPITVILFWCIRPLSFTKNVTFEVFYFVK